MLGEWIENAAYMAHGYCLFWNPWLIVAHAASDLVIFASYSAIPFAIWIYLRKRKDLDLRVLAVLFAVFILLCGLTHLIQCITLWWPIYEVQAWVKIATAVVSLGTAALIYPLIPQALAIPSPRQLQAVNEGLAAEITAHRKTLGDLEAARDQLELRVAERTEELRQLNQDLEARVASEVAKNREKDHILIQQSRLASMGEMVHNIAHQWRQPLNALGLLISNMFGDINDGIATKETLDEDVAKARRLIKGMTTTIDEFRDFFRPDREKIGFDAAASVREAISIVGASMKNNRIELECELEDGLTVSGHPNQYAQAVLNVMVNAKEAMIAHQVKDGRIRLKLAKAGEEAELSIEDEGGGIPADILPKIFDPYYTTKDQGSGIGLYMVKMIVEKSMSGRVEVANMGKGARFVFHVPLLAQASHKPVLLEPLAAADHGFTGMALAKG